MKKLFLFIWLSAALLACSPQNVGKVKSDDAVKVIQDSKSVFDGTSTSKAIAGLLSILDRRGRYVEIIGWSQNYRSGGTHDVWFKVKVNDALSEYHWVIDPDGTINPANQLAQSVTVKQMVSSAN